MGTIGKPTPITREDIRRIDPVKLEAIKKAPGVQLPSRRRSGGRSSSSSAAKQKVEAQKAAAQTKAKAESIKAAAQKATVEKLRASMKSVARKRIERISAKAQLKKEAQRKVILKAFKEPKKVISKIKIPDIKIKKVKLTQKQRESLEKTKVGAIEVLDVISGGFLTERKLDKKENEILKDIEKFNKDFTGRELSESESNKAKNVSKSIEERESSLEKERDDLAKSLRSKISTKFNIEKERLTTEQKKERIKQNKKDITKQEANIKNIDKELEKEIKSKTAASKIKVRILKSRKFSAFDEIKRLKEGRPPKILMGTVPISGASIPFGVTQIKFIGIQKKIKGGKILTDITFKTSTGRVGIAKGVSITKGKESASIVLGRSGKMAFKFPSGKPKIIKVTSFLGKEKAITTPTTISLKDNLDLLAKGKKIGTVVKTKKSIEALKQVGVGKVASVKGTKFMRPAIKFPSGKIVTKKVKGISVDDFASISSIITRKDLSLIVGKSITAKGGKSAFIGMIKGSGQSKKFFSVSEKQQYTKALQKVIASTSSALAKAEKTTGLTRAGKLAFAGKIVSDSAKLKAVKARPTIKPVVKVKPKPTLKVMAKPKPIQKVKIKAKVIKAKKVAVMKKASISKKPITKQRQRTITKQRQKPRQLDKQRTKQRISVSQKQLQKQKQLQRQTQKQKQIQLQKVKTITKPSGISPKIPLPIAIPRIKKKKIVVSKKGKKVESYDVLIRPLKKTKKGKIPKLIKANKEPITKSAAKDARNYIADTSLARTASIKKAKGKPQRSNLKVPKGYASKTSNKFRKHRTVKGERIPLPKGKVIERRKRLLDTRQEKRKITAKRRIAQIQKKPIKRKTSIKKRRKGGRK